MSFWFDSRHIINYFLFIKLLFIRASPKLFLAEALNFFFKNLTY
ncbi:hypothetical protein AB406_0839 [Riemerella anatipestifer]|uniref:Uncharacterized protein n=1 Tax=Riemerella anatipestifer TaxID=34085 RepID=A0A1S7DRR3_RIEAN|nr:hypothetical protein AB406_0839 [Riemerella anatipestifer]